MAEDYIHKLRKFASDLEEGLKFERNALDALKVVNPINNYTDLGNIQEPVVRSIVLYESTLRNLYNLFPEIRPKK
ncbi:hypothetical protein KW805_03010 [Candidatus Pacearchaeota archaeon]|nr:hypothetical protein [Candidatus Pacearchaeota archaeon]